MRGGYCNRRQGQGEVQMRRRQVVGDELEGVQVNNQVVERVIKGSNNISSSSGSSSSTGIPPHASDQIPNQS